MKKFVDFPDIYFIMFKINQFGHIYRTFHLTLSVIQYKNEKYWVVNVVVVVLLKTKVTFYLFTAKAQGMIAQSGGESMGIFNKIIYFNSMAV